MAWESRGNRRYFYRKRWVNGRVVSQYEGTSYYGLIAEYEYRAERRSAAEARDQRDRARKQQAKLDKQLADFSRQVRDYVAGVLVANGYHQHDRGEWRKRRDMSEDIQPAPQPGYGALNVIAHSVLRAMMVSGELDKKSRERIYAELVKLRSSLGWENSNGLERMLIESVVLSWLRLQFSDQILSANSAAKGYHPRSVAYLEARLSLANKRYLASVLALAKVRKLGNIQINIATNQVIAGGP